MLLYGIESYIAVPLTRRNGEHFGTLCALDPLPADLTQQSFEIFQLLAGLIAFELEADEQARAQSDALSQARQEAVLRDEFLSSVAHDIKNPLTSIRGYAALVQRRLRSGTPVPPERLLTTFDRIERSATKMAASLDELVDLARERMGGSLVLQREPTDLVALVREVVEQQQQATDRHQISVEADEPISGIWDQPRLERVVQNLVGNAVRYSPDGGRVTVAVGSRTDDEGSHRAVLRVTDQGVGIPTDDLGRIFERFHRGSNVRHRVSGTGIGLASVRQIVEAHGGQIEVESREGHGSTFTVSLPLPGE